MRGPRPRIGWLVVPLALLGCGSDPQPARPVASVDGVGITRARLEGAVERRVSSESERPRSDLLLEELDRLISDRVILNRADVLGVRVLEPEVDERLRVLFGGESEKGTPEFRVEVHRQMRIDRTTLLELAERLHISEDAIALHFETHRETFDTPPKLVIRHLLLQDARRAREIAAELREGADFAELARSESIALEAPNGGLLPPFARGEMPEVFDRAFDLPTGATSDPLESPFGVHLFLIEERIPARSASIDDARDRIRQVLEQSRLEELREGWLRQLRRTANIEIHERVLETLR